MKFIVEVEVVTDGEVENLEGIIVGRLIEAELNRPYETAAHLEVIEVIPIGR